MGKRTKEHNKKIAKRNEKIKQNENRFNKLRNQIFQQIMKEKQEGKFDDENLMKLETGNVSDGNVVSEEKLD